MVESIISVVSAAPLAIRVMAVATSSSATFALILVWIHLKRRRAAAGTDELHLAVATLLAVVAFGDRRFDSAERAAIEQLVRARFDLSADQTGRIVDAAEREAREEIDLVPFTAIVKDNFTPKRRIELIEMSWEVAYADGEPHDYQDSLVRAIAGLIYVSDHDRGAARKRVLKR